MDKNIYKKRLLSIFHDDVYSEIFNFWKMIEESVYDYKVFVSKKCYVLYKVFLPLLDFENTYQSCIKITDTALPMYVSQMSGKTVLIVDDVFIHGRTSLKISREIGQKAKKVDFYVFAKNSNIDEVQDRSTQDMRTNDSKYSLGYVDMINKVRLSMQDNLIKGYVKCDEYRWKRISDMIMKSFWGVNMPYISYLPVIDFNPKSKFIEKNTFMNDGRYSTHRQKELQQHFTYCVKTTEHNLENKAIIHYCFIISKNDYMQSTKLVPMIFFDCENTNINKEFIIQSIRTIYKQDANTLLSYFLDCKGSENGLLSLHKYLIFSVGYLAAKRWIKENGITEDEYTIDLINAKYSFGDFIENYLEILHDIDEKNTLKQIEKYPIRGKLTECQNTGLYLEEREKLLEGLRESFINTKSYGVEKDAPKILVNLAKFFKFNNMYDEKNIYKFSVKKHIRGLRFSEIKSYLEEKGYEVKEIISGLMHYYNLGAATIDFLYNYDANNNVIGINMHWRSGEQSYKCISQTYVPIVYFESMYRSLFNKRVSDFLYERLVEIAVDNYSVWNISFSKSDFEKYCSIKDNVYNAFDIEKYARKEEYKYLCYIGKQMQQYVLRGYGLDTFGDDGKKFKENLFEFMKKHTDDDMLANCYRVLFCERNTNA